MIFRVHYNWIATPAGEIYQDYTVGSSYEVPGETDEDGLPKFRKVVGIEYVKRGRNTRSLGYVIVKMDDGYQIIQDNIQSLYSKDGNTKG
jgi:hypothetical protein